MYSPLTSLCVTNRVWPTPLRCYQPTACCLRIPTAVGQGGEGRGCDTSCMLASDTYIIRGAMPRLCHLCHVQLSIAMLTDSPLFLFPFLSVFIWCGPDLVEVVKSLQIVDLYLNPLCTPIAYLHTTASQPREFFQNSSTASKVEPSISPTMVTIPWE